MNCCNDNGCMARKRVFIRGIRKICSAEVPPMLPSFGPMLPIRRFLNPCLPNVIRASLPKQKRQNLRRFEFNIKVAKRLNRVPVGSIAIMHIDRNPDLSSFNSAIFYNQAPTLTTTNQFLFIGSVDDIDNNDASREYFRYLHCRERLCLAGFEPNLADTMTERIVIKAAGNSYPQPLMGAALCPLLGCIGAWKEFADWAPECADEGGFTISDLPALRKLRPTKKRRLA